MLRSYIGAAMAAKCVCQGGLLLAQHCAPAGHEERTRELQPETGHRMDRQCQKTPGAFLLPFLLWDTGPDGEGIMTRTSHHPEPATAGKKSNTPFPAQAWVHAVSHLTSEEQRPSAGIAVCPLSSCESRPGQQCSGLLRLCGLFRSPLQSWLLLASPLPFGPPGTAKPLPSFALGTQPSKVPSYQGS